MPVKLNPGRVVDFGADSLAPAPLTNSLPLAVAPVQQAENRLDTLDAGTEKLPAEMRIYSVDELLLDPANVRPHKRKNIDAIKVSLTCFGQQKPIVVDPKQVVRAGNGTLIAARELGWKRIGGTPSDLEGAEAAAYSIADNRTTDLSEFHEPDLVDILNAMDPGLQAATGFIGQDVQALVDKVRATDTTALDGELAAIASLKESTITLSVPTESQKNVEKWLANGEPNTAGGRGRGVMKRCELL